MKVDGIEVKALGDSGDSPSMCYRSWLRAQQVRLPRKGDPRYDPSAKGSRGYHAQSGFHHRECGGSVAGAAVITCQAERSLKATLGTPCEPRYCVDVYGDTYDTQHEYNEI